MTAEYWDAYDENLNKIKGITLVRGEEIPEGLYHLVGEIIVRHTDGTYLLMQRDPHKHLGLKWELTAGGSALRGEGGKECALRELKEECGISETNPTFLTIIVSSLNRTIYQLFLCQTDIDKDHVSLQQGETVAYRWISESDLFLMDSKNLASIRTRNILKERK